jgi:hypothetical protein
MIAAVGEDRGVAEPVVLQHFFIGGQRGIQFAALPIAPGNIREAANVWLKGYVGSKGRRRAFGAKYLFV